MANFVLTYNGTTGSPAIPGDPDNGIPEQPEVPADPPRTFTINGKTITLSPGACVGLAIEDIVG